MGGLTKASHDFSGVEYPNNLWNCAKCHADGTAVDKATADGEAGPVAAEADLAYSNPTRRACGACHSDVNFETGVNHAGGIQTSDSLCKACHPASGAITSVVFPVKTVHDLGPTGDESGEISPSSMSISAWMIRPTADIIWLARSPIVTVTLKDHATGSRRGLRRYTPVLQTAGTWDGGLSTATLYVYGPRSYAVPVLTTCSTTDPDFDPPTQDGQPAGATATQGTSCSPVAP